MSKRLGESVKVVAATSPIARTAGALNGTVIDRTGFLDAVVHLSVGAATGTPTAQGVSLKIQTGALLDGSDMADVDGEIIPSLTANNVGAKLSLNLEPLKQYIRVVSTVTFTGGTTPAIPVAQTVILGNPSLIPQ